MADPFLEFAAFETQFGRDLTEAETPVATRLLQVVSDWIRGQKPDVDLLAAEQVVFEVTRDQVNLGQYSAFSQFQNTSSLRTEAGTFKDDDDLLDEIISGRQKRLLGIPLRAAPAYNFPVGDY